ncbi:MAG TPA: exo-alpha-sialidase [Longimicrobiales bacterium]|nr:exo-alpha-sialidase [Longimicrobiales bacterium]
MAVTSRLALFVLLTHVAACGGATEPSTDGGFPVENPSEVQPATPPTSGPWYHTVRSATSSDGLTFRDEREGNLVLHASVPSAIRLADGTVVVYFVDFSSGSPERLGCVVSRDRGATYQWGGCAISGLRSVKAVDPCPVLLEDGRVRLYYYASSDNVDAAGPHPIHSAISTDGIHFAYEATAFTADGLVDPDVFWTGSQWVMHVFSLAAGGTLVATSADGLSFAQRGVLEPRGYGVTKPLRLSDGTFRMYAFAQPDAVSFVSFRSNDGLAWTIEAGTRFTAAAGTQVTDPFVIARGDGTWLMVYKRQTRR